jgi:hypothetical protein
MTKRLFIVIISIFIFSCGSEKKEVDFDFTTVFEKSEGTETATYKEIVEYYMQLSEAYTSIAMYTMDKTDSGHPLHLITFNPDRTFESEFSERDKNIILINN